jgi:hypothetical protein
MLLYEQIKYTVHNGIGDSRNSAAIELEHAATAGTASLISDQLPNSRSPCSGVKHLQLPWFSTVL